MVSIHEGKGSFHCCLNVTAHPLCVCVCVFIAKVFKVCDLLFQKDGLSLKRRRSTFNGTQLHTNTLFFIEMAVRLKHMHTHHICRALGSQQNESKTVTISQTWMYPV